jgi:hypothetical protein
MSDQPTPATPAGRHCPFVNQDDARCGRRLSLGNLSLAMGQCFCDYATCPIYQTKLADRQRARSLVTLGLPRTPTPCAA